MAVTVQDLWGNDTDTDLPYQAHSETSREAAVAAVPSAGTDRQAVLDALRIWGPATDEWLQRFLEMNPSTQRPRRIELVRAGLVRDSGTKGVTSSGRSATAWEAV